MDIKLIVAMIGIASVVVSAIVQFFLGRQNEKAKKAVEIKAQAYLDLVNSVSEIASTVKSNGLIEQEQLKRLIQSKSRVVLIGSDEVLKEIHAHFTAHDKLDTDESFDSFSKLILAMRHDLSGKSNIELNILSEALFGSKNKT